MKIIIITTHPIQYYAPIFKLLAKENKVNIKVLYTWGSDYNTYKDRDFGIPTNWDLPLLEGYSYEFLNNIAKDKGTHHFNGINNPEIIEKIQEFDPNCILVYGWAWKSHLKVLRHFKGKIPVWFRGDSIIKNEHFFLKSLLRNLLLKWIYKHIDRAFYVGTENRNYFLKAGLKDDQLTFAPHAIDNERFNENKKNIDYRTKIGLKENDLLILFAAKLIDRKDPIILLEAFSKIQNKEVHLLIVGDGILEKSIINYIELKKLKNVHLMSFQNQQEMPSIYNACDIFCLPTRFDTWGLAINEAMATSKPILTTNMAGCAVDLVNNTNGKVIDARNESQLVNALLELIANKANLQKMGIASFKIIEKWSFRQQAQAFLQALSKLS